MRELLCNFFYLFINAYICYFFWRGSWLVATQLLREEIEQKQQTFFFVTFKNLFEKISFKLSHLFSLFFRRFLVKSSLKIHTQNQYEYDLVLSFSFLHIYIFWFFFLFLVWFFTSYIFEIILINIPMW